MIPNPRHPRELSPCPCPVHSPTILSRARDFLSLHFFFPLAAPSSFSCPWERPWRLLQGWELRSFWDGSPWKRGPSQKPQRGDSWDLNLGSEIADPAQGPVTPREFCFHLRLIWSFWGGGDLSALDTPNPPLGPPLSRAVFWGLWGAPGAVTTLRGGRNGMGKGSAASEGQEKPLRENLPARRSWEHTGKGSAPCSFCSQKTRGCSSLGQFIPPKNRAVPFWVHLIPKNRGYALLGSFIPQKTEAVPY